MPKISPETIDELRRMPMADFLAARYGLSEKKGRGHYFLGDGAEANIFPNTTTGRGDGWRIWDAYTGGERTYHGERLGGAGPLSWLTDYEGMDFREAVEYLNGPEPSTPVKPGFVREQAKVRPYHGIPTDPDGWPLVRNYLVGERKIPEGLVRAAWNAHAIVAGGLSDNHAWDLRGYVAFLGKQGDDEPACHATVRWALPDQPCPGEPKRQYGPKIGWFPVGHLGSRLQALIIVEAAIDALSVFAALQAVGNVTGVQIRAFAGNGGLSEALLTGCDRVIVATDADRQGDVFVAKAPELRPGVTLERMRPTNDCKDWNDAWQTDFTTMLAQWRGTLEPEREQESLAR